MSGAVSHLPDLSLEEAAWSEGHAIVAGVDEAGRGPWAGPVVAAAVVLQRDEIPENLNDSKKLSARERERLFADLVRCSWFGIGIADVERIDRDNILAATMWAMAEAVRALSDYPAFVLVDGNRVPRLDCACDAIVKGDGKSFSIAAASIVAKVTRDRMMCEFDVKYPGYGFARHKGYGTAQHRQALERLGPCPMHRKSFAPIRALLAGRVT